VVVGCGGWGQGTEVGVRGGGGEGRGGGGSAIGMVGVAGDFVEEWL